jgi:hypothetical protein
MSSTALNWLGVALLVVLGLVLVSYHVGYRDGWRAGIKQVWRGLRFLEKDKPSGSSPRLKSPEGAGKNV